MKDLIERLETATGPDRELDAQIYCAKNGYGFIKFERWNQHAGRLFYSIPGMKPHCESEGFPLYTGSLDAARTLIPPGLYWLAGEGKTRADELLGGARIFEHGKFDDPLAEGEHALVEIALCIAALNARLVTAGEAT